MRIPQWRSRPATTRQRCQISSRIFGLVAITAAIFAPGVANAIDFTEAPTPKIDVSNLGRIGIAGDFAGISLYQFVEQKPFNATAGESLLAQLPNGDLVPIVETDASILDMCTFVLRDGEMQGIVIGGNFTSLNGTPSPAVALFNPETSEITPLGGLQGQVNALFCDQEADMVYVGGNFVGANSTNAIAWYGSEGWTNLPFQGFNGPVNSITKAANGHIIFGGSFTGLGNASLPSEPDGQRINLETAEISSSSTTSAQGFSDAQSIVCSGGQTGQGNEWLLEAGATGFWQADLNFGFQPTKLRLYNTKQENRGTKTWRFTALPLGGILNMTYTDPETGDEASCTNQCPLSNDPDVEFQDFHFVRLIGMDSFRIDISEFFGDGAGLSGIELFSDEIFAYAVNEFNEPSCAQIEGASRSTSTGPWTISPSFDSNSQYLTAQLSGEISEDSASVVFFPDIKEDGEYIVNMYTPGCLQDDSCGSRGEVRITGRMTEGGGDTEVDKTIFQTNNFEKYDQIYVERVDRTSSGFRPSITLTPVSNGPSSRTVVAQRIGFTLINSTGGLNGLFDYDPTQAEINRNPETFLGSPINALGDSFDSRSAVSALTTAGDVTYIAGNFTSNNVTNIVALNTDTEEISELDGGLNGEVISMHINGSNIYVAGAFSNTNEGEVEGLNNVAVYSIRDDIWNALGGGVDGKALHVVPLNLTFVGESINDTVIAFSGEFSECLAFDDVPSSPCDGFAIWVPSQSNWLQNLNIAAPRYSGVLTASLLDIPTGDELFAGSVMSSQIGANGAVAVASDGLVKFDIDIEQLTKNNSSQSNDTLTRRDTILEQNSTGILTGAFYERDGNSFSILGGQFTAQGTDGTTVHNLAIIEEADAPNVTGLGPGISQDSTFVAVAIYEDTLFAGGQVSGIIGEADIVGFVSYDLASNGFNAQAPTLSPNNSTVSTILVQESTGDIYFGGSFQDAGSLNCPGVCYYSTSLSQWNRPGPNLEGTVNSLMWSGNSVLLAGGEMSMNGSSETYFLASYDIDERTWSPFPGSQSLPGPVDVITAGSRNGEQVWVSGLSEDGSPFLMKFNGNEWTSADEFLESGTLIQSLQIFTLEEGHEGNDFLESSHVLMVTGSIVIPDFGNASAATFNGTALSPYALTAGHGGSSGTIAKIFTQREDFFSSSGGNMPLVFIVLIGLAISLGLMLLLVLAGILLDRLRKKREGYTPAPTSMYDRGSGMQRIPPQELLQSLGKGRAGAPQV